MHKENLPQKVDPKRSAENGLRFEGTLPLKDMERLASGLADVSGDAAVKLTFGVDEQKIPFVRGHLTACLMLQCQRCLEPFAYTVDNHFLSGFVQTEEDVSSLPESYDPVVVKDGDFFISDLIEEELLVSLPIVPMHLPNECKVALPYANAASIDIKKENPFQVIESLRSKRSVK